MSYKRRDSTPPNNRVAVRLADVHRAKTDWLWPGYIPRGALSILDGDPGLGKSFITLDLAARVTRGWTMPPAAGTKSNVSPANVLLLNVEDDAARTIRPRLEALGADLNHVHLLNTVPADDGEVPVTFPGHLAVLEEAITELRVDLVIVDPLMAFLGSEVNPHKDSDVRRVLARIKAIAERTQAAVLLVRHLNKMSTEGEAVYRGGGSIGISGASRSALIVARHPANPCVRVLARSKGNLCEEPPALAYAIESDGGEPVVAWLGETDITANDLLAKKAPAKKSSEALNEAVQFLRGELTNGPLPAADIFDRAAKMRISEKTLRRAKGKLNIEAQHLSGYQSGWFWRLPNASSQYSTIWPSMEETREKHKGFIDGQMATYGESPEKSIDGQIENVAILEPLTK